MRDGPSPELTELLARLSLVTDRQLAGVSGRVRRLAGSLPILDSVWLDALVQAGRVTPFQAREIQAGRGAELACGPYVAIQRWPTLGYAEVLEANGVLLTVARLEPDQQAAANERLSTIAIRAATQTPECFLPLIAHGTDGGRLWVAWERPDGISASDWMSENGRLPPRVVLEIARWMLVGLCELEQQGLVHGDLHARSLFLGPRGETTLAFMGLRGVIRPRESINTSDLPPHCYDTLAPERAREAVSPNLLSDVFACGCVWWHLLTGRPAIAGGNSAAKLRNAAEGRVTDVRQLAPDTPEVLADLIASCTVQSPSDRPPSFAELARILGPPAEHGDRLIARAMRRAERWVLPRPHHKRIRNRLFQPLTEVGAVAVCLLLVVAVWRLMLPATGSNTNPTATPLAKSAALASVRPPLVAQPPDIQQVAFDEPVREKPESNEPEPLRLPEGRPLRLSTLSPVAGQRICGEHDGRVVVSLPADGLKIAEDDLHFENIDFLAAADAEVMLELHAPTVTFSGCRFLGGETKASRPIAIRWRSASTDDWLPASQRLMLVSCAFHRVDAAVDCGHGQMASIEATNVLQTRSGCLVRCALATAAKPLSLELDRCTLRDTGAVVHVSEMTMLESGRDRIRVVATDSVFQLHSGCALLELPVDFDESQLAGFKWLGAGSLCTLETPLAAVVDHDGSVVEVMDDAKLEITGLARSTLTFAGNDLDTAAESELRRWVAARRSKVPPGITASTGGG